MTGPKLDRRARPRDSAHVGRLARRFAEATDRTPGSASQRLTGGKGRLLSDAIAFLEICRDQAHRAEGEAFLHVCSEALNGHAAEPWRPELVDEIALLDAVEDARLVGIAQRVEARTATLVEVQEYARLLMREIAGKFRLYDAAIALSHKLRTA